MRSTLNAVPVESGSLLTGRHGTNSLIATDNEIAVIVLEEAGVRAARFGLLRSNRDPRNPANGN